MEEKITDIFKLCDSLNKESTKLYAELKYYADDSKTFQIIIREKNNYKYVEKCELSLANFTNEKLDVIKKLIINYIECSTKKENQS